MTKEDGPDFDHDWLQTWKDMEALYKAHPDKIKAIGTRPILEYAFHQADSWFRRVEFLRQFFGTVTRSGNHCTRRQSDRTTPSTSTHWEL